jgi:hypothetical protein
MADTLDQIAQRIRHRMMSIEQMDAYGRTKTDDPCGLHNPPEVHCGFCQWELFSQALRAILEARADALRDAADAFEALSKRRDILPPTFGEVAQSLRARATEASKGGQ